MYIVKNAFRCIMRSRTRNILIGIIVLVIAVSACIGLSIRSAAASAKESTMSTLSVTATISYDRKSMMNGFGGGKFNREEFTQSMSTAEQLTLADYEKYAAAASVSSFYYTASIYLDGTDAISPVANSGSDSSGSDSGFGSMPPMGNFQSGDFSITGYSSDSAMTDFISGNSKISSGSVFESGTEHYDCIITEELATYNSLSVGDTITLVNPDNISEAYELTIVGIYESNETNDGFSMFGGMGGSSDPANNIYMSYAAVSDITAKSANTDSENALTSMLSATYSFATANDYYAFEEEVRELGLSDSYSVSSNDITEYENSIVPLNTLSKMAGYFLLIILIIGAVILVVLNIFNIRERKYEIGVLCAMGMKKYKVALQFMCEIFMVTLTFVIIGIGISSVCSVPISNALLESQIESQSQSQNKIEQNFGRGEMPNISGMGSAPEMPSGGFGGFGSGGFGSITNTFGSASSYVSEINSTMNLTVVLEMLGIAVLLTLVSGAVAVMFVMRYEPLKILSNRD